MSAPDRRRARIVEHVVSRGEASVDDLASLLGVSAMTVYRDVAQLESQGLVLLRRGEVRAANSSLAESAATIRKTKDTAIKDALAQAAMQFIRPGMSICFDDSTTNLAVVRRLREFTPATVITNAQFIANAARVIDDLTLILTGGVYVTWADAYTGLVTEAALGSLRADTCIMSATAVSTDACFHPAQEFAAVKRAMLSMSLRSILLVDSSKFARTALFRVGPLTDFDAIIVDEAMPSEFCEAVNDAGAQLVVAPST